MQQARLSNRKYSRRRSFLNVWAFLFLVVPAALRADVMEFTPGAEPVIPRLQEQAKSARAVQSKATEPSFALALPFYAVDPGGSVSTLFAVKNTTGVSVTMRVAYFPAAGGASVQEVITLAPHRTFTRNIQDVPSLPVDAEANIKIGSVVINAIDPVTLQPVASNVLGGDYFRVEPTNNFASGSSLLDLEVDRCSFWHMRFFNGGPFNGGTSLYFWLPFNEGDAANRLVAQCDVYDEPGNHRGVLSIFSSKTSTVVNTAEVTPSDFLGTFGALECGFVNGQLGHLSGEFRASGRFSVGLPAICADIVE